MTRRPGKEIREAIDTYPAAARKRVLALRELILETAEALDSVGPLTETLKWGEPAYLPAKRGIGSTVRIAWNPRNPRQYAMYFICNTNLVDTFRTLFPEQKFEGNRALLFDLDEDLPVDVVATCVELTLTYHLRKRDGQRRGRK